MKIPRYLIEFAVFVSGAIVMIFEIVGSRVLAPYLGTSIFVWTSLIGIILASLSLGYYLGGKLGDYRRKLSILSYIFLLSSIILLVVIMIKDEFLKYLILNIEYTRINTIISSVVLFAPLSVFLGMVSPYAIRLKMINLESSGSTVGNLYALSTLGSIVGTFGAGFFLIPAFGTNNILFGLAISLMFLSLIISGSYFLKARLLMFMFMFLLVFAYNYSQDQTASVLDLDTEYSRVWIYDTVIDGDKVRRMRLNGAASSAKYLEKEGLVFKYTRFYHLASHFVPNFKNTLVIGGAAYSVPQEFLDVYEDVNVDVVEIDPALTELAKKYFGLEGENPRLSVYHQDARIFLNNANKKYDVIIGDAFKSHSIPYQLTTQEVIQKEYDLLSDEGVVLLNVISSLEGEQSEFLRAEYMTYKSVFPQVYVFVVNRSDDMIRSQNLLLVALKSDKVPSFTSEDEVLNEYLSRLYTKPIPEDMYILTDDYAPVDYYISKIIK